MAPLEMAEVQVEAGLDPERLERVRHGGSGHRERMPASAAAGLLGVLELETLEHERLLPVKHRPAQVEDALLVAIHAHGGFVRVRELKDQITRAGRGVVE